MTQTLWWLCVAGVLVAAIAWTRFAARLGAESFEQAFRPADPAAAALKSCSGSLFARGTSAWQVCAGPGDREWFLTRFDLGAGTVEVRGRLDASEVYGAVHHPADPEGIVIMQAGDLVFATSDGEPEVVAGPGLLQIASGLAWNRGVLEIVTWGHEGQDGRDVDSRPWRKPPLVHAWKEGRWQSREVPTPRIDRLRESRLELAYAGDSGWTFLFASLPRTAPLGAESAALEILVGTEHSPARPVQRMRLPVTADPAGLPGVYVFQSPTSGSLHLPNRFDVTRGGRVHPSGASLERKPSGRWEPLEPPPGEPPDLPLVWRDYEITEQGLRPILHAGSPRYLRLAGDWLPHPAPAYRHLVPSPARGYVALAGPTRYVRFDARLQAIPVARFERLRRWWAGELLPPRGAGVGLRWRASLPFLLLFPLLMAPAVLAWRRGSRGPCYLVAIVYLAGAGLLLWHFWAATALL